MGDPAAGCARWLYEGAPAPIEIQPELSGVCISVGDDEVEIGADDLTTNYEANSRDLCWS